jgi:tetratricopeptide (TPR) repeat protein
MRRYFVVGLALLLAASLCAGCVQQIKARMELKKGNAYYKQEAYKEALAQFQKGLEMDPTATFAWRSVGLSAMALFRPGNMSPDNLQYANLAADAFKKHISAFPNDEKNLEKTLNYLITIYLNSQQFNEAIDYLQAFRKEHPEFIKVLQPLLTIMVKAGRVEDAYKLALSDAPQEAVLFYTIAVNAWAKSYYDPTLAAPIRRSVVDTGLRSINRSLELKPDFASMAYINLLYREKAKLTMEPAKQKLWSAGADGWGKKAVAVRTEQKRLEELAKPAEEKPKQEQPQEGAKPA